MIVEYIPAQYNILWTSSWISLYPTIEAFKQKKYDLAFCSGSVFLTSINYWYFPIKSWRKTLDIMTVNTVICYQLYRTRKLTQYRRRKFLGLTILGVSSFLLSKYSYNRRLYWDATYFHFGLHIIGNLGNFILLEE